MAKFHMPEGVARVRRQHVGHLNGVFGAVDHVVEAQITSISRHLLKGAHVRIYQEIRIYRYEYSVLVHLCRSFHVRVRDG